MHSQVIVKLDNGKEFKLDMTHLAPMSMEDGRRWLDDQFIELDCEPLRPSGKVLLADKVLVVARAAANLFDDADWLNTYARATHAVLSRPLIRVDVPAMTVGY